MSENELSSTTGAFTEQRRRLGKFDRSRPAPLLDEIGELAGGTGNFAGIEDENGRPHADAAAANE